MGQTGGTEFLNKKKQEEEVYRKETERIAQAREMDEVICEQRNLMQNEQTKVERLQQMSQENEDLACALAKSKKSIMEHEARMKEKSMEQRAKMGEAKKIKMKVL